MSIVRKWSIACLVIGLFVAAATKPVLAGTNFDLASSSSYDLLITGSATAGRILTTNPFPIDIDGDGKQDLLIGAFSGSGTSSVYLIYGSLLETFQAGSTINLDDVTKWNVRFKSSASPFIGFGQPVAGDVTGDGKMEVAFNNPLYPNDLGSVWVVNNAIFGGLSGTGNVVDIDNTSNYNFRFSSPDTDNAQFGYIVKFADVNNNGRADLLIEDAHNTGEQVHDGAIYIIYDSVMNAYSGSTGNQMPLGTSSNYSLALMRNGGNSPNFSFGDFNLADINGDGKLDLEVGSKNEDFSADDSGSVYVFYNNLIGGAVGTGNLLDISETGSFSLRFDGATINDFLGGYAVEPGDVTGDGRVDLMMAANNASNNSRSSSGSVYVISNDLFSSYTGTDNVIELSDSTTWTVRIDGAASGDRFGNAGAIVDFNTDGKNDLFIGAGTAGNNDRLLSGSVYLVEQSLFNLPGTGNILDMVNSNNYTSRFDGAEASSRLSGYPDNTTHEATGLDVNNDGGMDLLTISRTYGGSVGALYVFFGVPELEPASNGGNNPNVIPGWAKPISVGPHYFGGDFTFITASNRGGVGITGGAFSPVVGVLASNSVHHDDLYVTFDFPQVDLLTSQYQVPLPWAQGFNVASEIYGISAASSFNGYPVMTTDNPFTIRVPYYPNRVGGGTPQIIWFNPTTSKWQKLMTPSLVDPINMVLMTTTNNFGFFGVSF